VRQFVLDAEAADLFTESVTFEAKEKRSGTNVVEAVAALSNTDGGIVLVGVKDQDATGEARITGVPQREHDVLVSQLHSLIPAAMPQVIPVAKPGTDRLVIVLRVDADAVLHPVIAAGKVLHRLPGQKAPADRQRIIDMIARDTPGQAQSGPMQIIRPPWRPQDVPLWPDDQGHAASAEISGELRVVGGLTLPPRILQRPWLDTRAKQAAVDALNNSPLRNSPAWSLQPWFFAAGAAYLEAVTESDRDVLAVSMQMPFQPRMVLDVRVADAPLPADLTMRGGRAFGPCFQAGAAQVQADLASRGSAQVRWPSSWTSLAAVARTRGLRVSPSPAGQAAATLIRALGSVDAIRWLAHRPLITLLYRLAERSGMSWQKSQLNRLRARIAEQGSPADVLDETEAALSAPEHAVTPAGEGRALAFEDFRKALAGSTAAARWVTWAERHHLLVRGVNILCPHCEASSWLPIASMPPPVGCPGCGRSLDTPYDPRHVPFAYRIGEPLRRVLETDSLGHVLTLHWLTRLFGDARGLIGSHPGVDFYAGDGKGTIGEADVLLMFTDGRLVPVEVKRTAVGVDARALELMDRLAAALHAPYDVVAVSQPARDCPGLPASIGQPSGRPRLLISEDQILNRRPFWAAGSDPFAWAPRTEQDDRERDTGFTAELEASGPDQPWDLVRDTLLGEQ
jgi:hypothetical protein